MTEPLGGCLFCRIVAREIPVEVVREADRTLAFRDIEPQAPVHVLVISRDHHRDVGGLVAADLGLAGELVAEAAAVAEQEGLSSYRLVVNTGAQAGQSVFHVHAHVLGGRSMLWPPG